MRHRSDDGGVALRRILLDALDDAAADGLERGSSGAVLQPE